MFERIKSLLSVLMPWRASKTRQDIFSYSDGERLRRIDPMIAYRALEDHPTFNRERHSPEIDAGDTEAVKIGADAVSDVFGVQPYDGDTGKGLTEAERINLLAAFYLYLADLKKNSSQPPTSSARSGFSPPPQAELAMNSSSA